MDLEGQAANVHHEVADVAFIAGQKLPSIRCISGLHRVSYVSPKAIPPSEMLLMKASTIAHDVASGRSRSEYSPLNAKVGERHCYNCYGFVNSCLRKVVPEAYEELVSRMVSLKEKIPVSFDGLPCPFNFASVFQINKLKYWERVFALKNIRAGDIIVYLPTDRVPDEITNKKTGTHVMIVKTSPTAKGEGYSFSVIDCTRKAHGKKDSRFPDKTGVGTSSVFLIPRGEDQYTLMWEEGRKEYTKRITIGRLKDTSLTQTA